VAVVAVAVAVAEAGRVREDVSGSGWVAVRIDRALNEPNRSTIGKVTITLVAVALAVAVAVVRVAVAVDRALNE
jgi:hypothetical protein